MGALLVQLARAAGARAVGAARGARKLELALELGAEAVADYSIPGWTRQVREATDGTYPSQARALKSRAAPAAQRTPK